MSAVVMEKLVSSWSSKIQSLPENYVFPLDARPGDSSVPLCKTIPIIDLGKEVGYDQNDTIQQILHACQEFGFFQAINHGISENLMDGTMKLFKEFFEMPDEDKASVYSNDPDKSCTLFTSTYDYANEALHYWRDNLRHPCHPLHECIHSWPEKPTRYRDIVGKYSIEVKNLSYKILELISEGLGLDEPGYFGDNFTGFQLLSVNHYPPCPDPSLTLGLPRHADANLITLLLQEDVYGLQVLKDGQWIGVEPLPNAFVVITGHQLQIISNGKLKSAEHRAVTNSSNPRTTIVYSINPRKDCIIEPAKALISKFNPPLYRTFQFKEFLKTYNEKKDYTEAVLAEFKVQA